MSSFNDIIKNIDVETEIFKINVKFNENNGSLIFLVENKNISNNIYIEETNIEDISLSFSSLQKYEFIYNCLMNENKKFNNLEYSENFYVEFILDNQNNILNINFNAVLNNTFCIGFSISLHEKFSILNNNTENSTNNNIDNDIDNNINNDYSFNSVNDEEINNVYENQNIDGWNRIDFLEFKYLSIEKNIEKLFETIEQFNDKIIKLEKIIEKNNLT
jgi:hypothetical protein